MLQLQFRRFIQTGVLSSGGKSLLAKLRKKTGYSIINCKKALELNNNEISQAEKWLQDEAQKQGWAKAIKFQNRAANQGLIGLHIQKNAAAIVEVSCETDFVSRNDQFKDLVKIVASTCFQQISSRLPNETNELTKYEVPTSDMGNLSWDKKTLADKVALSISQLGENIVLKRATVWQVNGNVELGGAVHPAQPRNQTTLVGSYGAIVAFESNGKPEFIETVTNQLSVHIIGMNPKELTREIDELETKVPEPEAPEPEAPVANNESPELSTKEAVAPEDEEEDNYRVEETKEEPALLLQKFIFNEDLTVKEFLEEKNVKIVDFLRFECGEKNENVE